MTSRIHRGFHRIGVVLAVPVLLLSIGLAGHEAWLQWMTLRLPDETLRWQAVPFRSSGPSTTTC